MKNAIFAMLVATSTFVNAQEAVVTKEQVEAAKNAIDLRIYQEIQELSVQKATAEARKAIAEAEKAEASAKLPTVETKSLPGNINTDGFGSAALVRAYDLAKNMATSVCDSTKSMPNTIVIYEANTIQAVVSAKALNIQIKSLTQTLKNAKQQIDSDQKSSLTTKSVLAIASVTTGLKAIADLASIFKSNVTVKSNPVGDAATRAMFSTALAERCSNKIIGLGSGYLGELDLNKYNEIQTDLIELLSSNQLLKDSTSRLKKRAVLAKGDDKINLDELLIGSNNLIKQSEAFIESLKLSDFSEKSTVFLMAKYLAYSERTLNSLVLDYDLKLEGLSLIKENIFTGQRLRISGVAYLWYRIHSQDGTILKAETIQQITKPVEVDLRGESIQDSFWIK